MRFRGATVAIASVSFLALSACQTDPNSPFNKQNIGTVLGGVGGAVIGSQFGGGTGRLVATVIGAGAGAFLGNQLGRSLDEADRQQIAKADSQALDTAAGQPISWRNPDSGATGSAQAAAPTSEVISKAPDGTLRTVSKTPKLNLISGAYSVKGASSVNVRAEPNTQSAITGSVRPGETVDAVGKVVGSDWILIGRGGQTVGYVAGNLIAPVVATASNAPATPSTPAQATTQSSAVNAAQPIPFKLVEAPTVSQPVPVASVANQPAVSTAPTEETTCRMVTRSVQKNGESAQEQIKYCKTAEGWQKVEA